MKAVVALFNKFVETPGIGIISLVVICLVVLCGAAFHEGKAAIPAITGLALTMAGIKIVLGIG